jgi:hypothetical protein
MDRAMYDLLSPLAQFPRHLGRKRGVRRTSHQHGSDQQASQRRLGLAR